MGTTDTMNSLALLLATALLAATSASATDFVCPEPYGFYENPDNCIKYYQCTDDIAQEQICGLHPSLGTQMYYDPVNIWCEELSKVDCGDRPICDANDQNCQVQTTPDPRPGATFPTRTVAAISTSARTTSPTTSYVPQRTASSSTTTKPSRPAITRTESPADPGLFAKQTIDSEDIPPLNHINRKI